MEALKPRPPRIGMMVRNKLSGRTMEIVGLRRTKRGRAWALAYEGREFICHLSQFTARYEVVG